MTEVGSETQTGVSGAYSILLTAVRGVVFKLESAASA
ncbi:hypothetical protein MGAST_27600 [Mycobacterium gastri 'Wayne']|nr:hypothetical protein MGAST_27600 [Mycobacterium gastri 'Wayne']